MKESFALVARSLLATGSSIAPIQTEVGATTEDLAVVAALFSRLASIGDGGSLSSSTTLLVFAPSCAAQSVAKHVAASLGAGNAVQIALFEPAEPLLLILFAILTELLPDRFDVLSDGTNWKAGAVESSIVVVTEADAFVNSAPWVHYRPVLEEISAVGLIEFYSTVPAAGCDPR